MTQASATTSEPTGSRKVVAYLLISLDGVTEAPDRFFPEWDDAMDDQLGEVIGTQDAVVLGRRSYDEWADFWPGSPIEPFASFINAVPKYVATSTPLDRDWDNAQAIDGDLVGFVRELKAARGGDIGVHASTSVTRSLLAAGLVDELRLVVAPTVVGSGHRLFEGLSDLRFETVGAPRELSGYLLANFKPLPAS